MAEIAINKDIDRSLLLVEDPISANNRIFIKGQSFDATTLTPNWMEDMAQWGATATSRDITKTLDLSGLEGGASNAAVISLEKGTITGASSLDAGTSALASNWNKGGFATYHRSKDFANYPCKTYAFQGSSGTTIGTSIVLNYSYNNGTTTIYNYAGVYPGNDLSTTSGYYYEQNGSMTNGTVMPNVVFYYDPTTSKTWGYAEASTTTATGFGFYHSTAGTLLGSVIPMTTYGSAAAIGNDGWFMGVDDLGFLIFVVVANGTQGFATIRVNPNTAAVTTLIASSAQGLAEAGAHRRPSNVRRASSTRRVWYSSHFNASSILTPIRYVLDTTTGAVTATSCTMTYPGANTYATYAAKNTTEGYTATGQATESCSMQPHQWTQGGVNYITFFLLDKAPTVGNAPTRWNSAAKRTVMTYTIGSGTGDDVLTYHSSFSYSGSDQMPYDFMPIVTDGSSLVVARNSNIYFLNFNAGTGWVETGPYGLTNVRTIGLDSQNRLWATAQDKNRGTVHLITPTTPVSVNVVMASATGYTYSGSTINTTATVNAYGTGGTRIVANVTLTIDGNNMVFASNSSKTLTVATSASGDTTVNLTITGGGINNISASVVANV
jgi:hypothetical protein